MPETVDQQLSDLEDRRNYIDKRLAATDVPTPDNVFDPLLTDFDELLEEIQYDIETLATLSDDTSDFYEEICSDLWDAHSRLQKIEKIISYYELHTDQESDSTAVFDNVRTVVDELCHPLGIDFDIIPICWNQTALVTFIPEAVYGLWLPRNISTASFNAFAPLIAHEIAHVTMDYRDGYTLPDSVNQERRRIASEFDNREETVTDALRYWYEELYCDTIGTLTFGPAYAVSLTRRLFSDNPYKLPAIHVEQQHPPDALRYRHVMNILADEYPEELHRLAQRQTADFRHHLDQLSSKRTPNYTDWWDDRFLDAIADDTKQFFTPDTRQLADALTQPDADTPDTVTMRARVNRSLLETA
mgnify:CR=1 FL=1